MAWPRARPGRRSLRSLGRRHASAGGQRGRLVRRRWLWVPLLGLVIAVPAGWLWHRWQMSRLGEAFAEAAARAEAAEHWAEAEFRLRSYLRLRPHDPAALARLARLVDRQAQTPRERARAAHHYAAAVAANPNDVALVLRLGELRLEADPEFAREAAAQVLTRDPQSDAARMLEAQACDRLAERPIADDAARRRAIEAYEALVARHPENLAAVLRLATLLHRAAPRDGARPVRWATAEAARDEARRLVDQTVSDAPARLEPRLLRYTYRRLTDATPSTPPEAAAPELDPDLAAALRLAPQHVEVLLAVAEAYLPLVVAWELPPRDGLPPIHPARLSECRRYLEEATRLAPRDPRPALALAQWHGLAHSPQEMPRVLTAAGREVPEGVWLFSARAAELLLWGEEWPAAADWLDRWSSQLAAATPQGDPAPAEWRVLSNLLWARWCLATANPHRRPGDGLDHLEAATALARTEGASAATWGEIGRARLLAGQADLAVAAYRRALEQAPGTPALELGLARSLRGGGQLVEAVAHYRAAVEALPGGPWSTAGPVWLELAETLLALQTARPAPERDWNDHDQALARAAESLRGDHRLALALAESRLHRTATTREAWLAELRALARVFRAEPRFWRDLAALLARAGEPQAAREALDRAAADAPTDQPLVAATFAAATPDARSPATVAPAEEWASDGSPPAQAGYSEWLAEIERALAESDWGHVEWCAARLRELGADGRSLADYATLRSELARLRSGGGGTWDHAAARADELVAARPQWPLSHAARGQVAEFAGDHAAALTAYFAAWELGDRRTSLARRLLGLALITDQPERLAQVWRELPEPARLAPEVVSLGVRALVANEESSAALALVEAAAVRRPDDEALDLLRARVLLRHGLAGDVAEAGRILGQAVERHPGSLAAWLGWSAWHAETLAGESSDRALGTWRATRAAALAAGLAGAAWRHLVVGVAADGEGRFDMADQAFRAAAAAGEPLDDEIVDEVVDAGGWFRTDTLSASPALQMTSATSNVHSADGSRLAACLAASLAPDERPAADELPADPRCQALARLLAGGPAAREEAGEHVLALDPLGPGDHVLMAQAAWLDGEPSAVQAHLTALAGAGQPSPEQLLAGAELALDSGLFSTSTELLARLRTGAGDDPRADFLELALAVAQHQTAAAIQRAEDQLEKLGAIDPAPPWAAQRVVEIATLVARVDPNAAERMIATADGALPAGQRCQWRWWATRPEAGPRFAEALALGVGPSDRPPDDAVLAELACQWLFTHEVSSPGFAEVHSRVGERVAATERGELPTPLGLWANWAVVCDQQGNPAEALRLTELALEQSPAQPALLNNRAWLEATHLNHPERARTTLAEAFRAAGPLPALIDTLVVVELAAGEPRRAIALGEGIVVRPGTPAGWWLHLAEAYEAAGETLAAERALTLARERGLTALAPRDRTALADLETRLRGPGDR